MFEASWLTLLVLVAFGVASQARRQRMDVFDPVFVSSVAYGMFFLVPLLVLKTFPDVYRFNPDLAEKHVAEATLLVALFFGAQLIGHRVGSKMRLWSGTLAWDRITGSQTTLVFAALVLYAIAWIARLVVISEGQYFQSTREDVSNVLLTSYAKNFEELYLVALSLLGGLSFIAQGRTHEPERHGVRRLFWALCVIELAFALPSGRKETVLLIPFILLYVLNQNGPYIARRSLLIYGLPVLAATVLYFVLNQAYRLALEVSVAEHGSLASLASMEGVAYFMGSALQTLQEESGQLIEIAGMQAAGRLGGAVEPLFHFLELTPSVIPYKLGASYNALVELVPRAIWIDKPITSLNTVIARDYGMLAPDDFSTSVSVGVPGEAFMNFGYVGVLSVGFIAGYAFTRTRAFFLNERGITPLSAALYLPFVLMFTLRIQTGFLGSYIGAVKLSLLALSLIWIATNIRNFSVTHGGRQTLP